MERRYEGAWTKTHCVPGDVSLLTRSQRSHWHWTEEIDVSHVYLTETLVSRVCAEVTDRCVADVQHDPIVTAAVAAITREAQQQPLGSEAASPQLQHTRASVCGFADQAHMTRVFQTHLNTTPAALRL